MIKNLTFLGLALAFICSSCSNQPAEQADKTHVITDIKGGDFDTLLVQQLGASGWITIDTLIKENGLFHYRQNIASADLIKLSSVDKNYQARIFIEPGDVLFSDSADNSQPIVKESNVHTHFITVKDSTKVFDDIMGEALSEYRSLPNYDDTLLVQSIIKRYDTADSLRLNWVENWIAENLNSPVAQYLYIAEKMSAASAEELSAQIQLFDSTLAHNSLANRMRARVDVLNTTAIGAVAPVFSLADTSGNLITSSSVYGKVTLIDFWASWCGPCRRENPNVVAAYTKYHEKGFEILGVSLDKDANRWKKAIKDDALTWNHVSDLKGWETEAGALYGVNAIPFSVLVDANGKIIAKDLRGEELHIKLSELLD